MRVIGYIERTTHTDRRPREHEAWFKVDPSRDFTYELSSFRCSTIILCGPVDALPNLRDKRLVRSLPLAFVCCTYAYAESTHHLDGD
jgi:hypothetical protein